MITIIFKIKNSINMFDSRLDEVEEKISKLKWIYKEII